MPLYEYECVSCRKVHEVMQKFSDEPMRECPECHGAVSKLMSRSSFALKGSGWYTTDYKRAAKPAAPATSAAIPATGVTPAAPAPAASATSAASAVPAAASS